MYNVHIAKITDGKTNRRMTKQEQSVHRSGAISTKTERDIEMQQERDKLSQRKIHRDIQTDKNGQTDNVHIFFSPPHDAQGP